jgi:hypothetical protein
MHTIYDSDYCGSDDGLPAVHCKCRKFAGKFVAFKGWCTGRRFLGYEGEVCALIQVIDCSMILACLVLIYIAMIFHREVQNVNMLSG